MTYSVRGWLIIQKQNYLRKQMFGIENFILFLTTGLLINLYPGPDTMYIVARSMSQGRLAGVFAVLGISSGSLFHTIIGSIGLSALLLSSAKAFMVIKYAGAIYLFYQAVLMITDSIGKNKISSAEVPTSSLFKIYKQGALTNILNPKVALFFMALLPQFISPTSPSKLFSFIVLGIVFITTGTIWCLLLAVFASFFSKKLRSNTMMSKWLLRSNAVLFTYLGVQLINAEFSTNFD
jgi:threonine/homoserine/homoserine lactone efflux protein